MGVSGAFHLELQVGIKRGHHAQAAAAGRSLAKDPIQLLERKLQEVGSRQTGAHRGRLDVERLLAGALGFRLGDVALRQHRLKHRTLKAPGRRRIVDRVGLRI